MFALGGATYGHVWSEHEFLESHPRLDINALHRAGALIDGAETTWQWEGGTVGSLRATGSQILLSGNFEQTIRFDWLPLLNNRYVRPRFLCPGCGRGAYHLHEKAGTFLCHVCCGYDWKSRHRQRFTPAFRRIAMLRKKLGADPAIGSPLPPRPRWRMSRLYYDRIAAELARWEATAYADIGRVLADLDQRIKP